MIKIRGLSKTFNKGNLRALDNVSCDIGSNKIVGFIGPDGAGKTTLLRIVAGILIPDSGNIFVDNIPLDLYEENRRDAISIAELHRMISYMPQKFGQYEDLSVIENLELYARLHELDKKEKQAAFEEVLQITKLANFKNRLAGNLSGGMKQKLGLACALLKKPKILILDEPSVGVDPISRNDLIKMVNSMLNENTTVLWSTAYLDEAEDLDHVVLLNNGKIIFENSPEEAIKTVTGRVFLFSDIKEDKRHFSSELLKIGGVMDSVITGQNVKVLVKDAATKLLDMYTKNATKPTFEDACIDMLGGLLVKESPIARHAKDNPFTGDDIVVEAINLTKNFGDFTAVDDVSFSVRRGKIFGLLGPNGSGKSTTFKMLCGLLRQNSGTAKITGIDIQNMSSDAKMNIGYMAQKFSLYSILSVKQNLEFAAGAYRLSGSRKRSSVEKMLEIFHLSQYQNVNAGLLSLGFKQRLALACAIMHNPQVLFLDEPTSGVDPITRREFWLHINAMVMSGVSVVVTTHFMDEAENCDEIALVYKGKMRAIGSPDELKTRCKSSELQTLNQAFIDILAQAQDA
ncbi:MAG: ATP-binding cassette domain-containing protein [Holosporales bacterium]|jgi:ABC-2 type transport system ATP-binding protein|nr:ATP-binding cassette domain-containing protein [Holosporales bacterium]